jgi:transposase InsO family protein
VSKEVVATVRHLQERAEYPVKTALSVLGLPRSTFFDWARLEDGGKAARPPATTPKAHHITPIERAELGHKRLAYALADTGIAAVRPTTVYEILKEAGLIGRWKQPEITAHKTGFDQPALAHEQWHTDIAYLNIHGTQYFLISVLDGFSRAIIHHDVRLKMETDDVELIIQRALDTIPKSTPRPRIISDNGSQYISGQFKTFLRNTGCSHSKARVRHPQSNGKIERWHKTIKGECVRRAALGGLDEARSVLAAYVQEYNETRLHSALNYLTPADYLKGAEHVAARLAARKAVFEAADRKRREHWAKAGAA